MGSLGNMPPGRIRYMSVCGGAQEAVEISRGLTGHWGVPRPSKQWEDQSALHFPRVDTLQVHLTTYLKVFNSASFIRCLGKKSKGESWVGPWWGCGHGTDVPSPSKAWEDQSALHFPRPDAL